MLPYWLLFSLWAVGAVQAERRNVRDSRLYFFIPAALLTTLMIGLRNEVGGDWGAYQRMLDDAYFMSLPEAMRATDPAYGALNWIASKFDLGVTFVNLICAFIFMGGVGRLAWKQPNPALAMLVGVPYFIIVVAMGYTRQAAAIGLLCFAIADASEKRLIRLIGLIGLATLFHKTAILMLPIALVPILRRNSILGVFGFLIFIILFGILLGDTSDRMITDYVQSDYDSQGAAIRVSMNVVAGVTFLALRRRLDFSEFERSFWTICSVLSIVSLAALFVASASSGIDRMSLYFIPLQLIAYSRIPYAINYNKTLSSAIIALIAYAFSVQFVWLNYADNAAYWVPYKI